MELEIFKDKLIQGLSIAERLAKKNINLPILSNVLLESEKNFLKLSATNLESSIKWMMLAKVKTLGKVCLSASFLRSLLEYVKEEKIRMETEKNDLVLKNENQKIRIRGVNPDDFPIIPKVETENFIEVDGEALNKGINQVVNIPSFNQVRPEISGIYFLFKKEELKVVGTDSFRLAEKTIELPEKIKKEIAFILPQFTTRELLNILSIKKGKVKVYFTKNQILFEWLGEENPYPEIQFYSSLIEGEYPNYQEIIPKKYETEIIIKREEFQNQIKKAGLFSGKISEVKITILPQKNKIRIFSESSNVGESEAELGVKIEKGKEDIQTSFNYRFLLDGLSNIKSSDVVFSLSDKEGPAVIKGVDDESYLYILMPIKTA